MSSGLVEYFNFRSVLMQGKYPFDHKVIYIHGLYGSGKSRMLYLMAKHYHFHDLCLSLTNISKSKDPNQYMTDDTIRVRNNNGLRALSIPLHNLPLARKIIIAYKYSYPVKNIIIDEVERVKLTTLRDLLIMLRQEFPHVGSIVLAGIITNNDQGIPFHTCEYLAGHCKTIGIKCHCQFCNRVATHILLVYKGEPINQLGWYNYFNRKYHFKGHRLMHIADKYYVCRYHLDHPPMNRVMNTQPKFRNF